MNVSRLIKEKIEDAVVAKYGIKPENVQIEHPENEKWGDYASNIAMVLSKQIKQPPIEIAKNISYEIQKTSPKITENGMEYEIFEKIDIAQPGFINIKLSKHWLQNVLYEVQIESDAYGSSDFGGGKRVLIEFSQPNPNKPLHIGHSRNNFLGSSIANILSFQGYDTIKVNYMNDWGTHIVKSMLMYKKYGNNAEPTKKPDHFVGDFYIMYEKEVENKPELADELAEMFRKLEAGDPETVELWKKIVSWAYEGWKITYENENVHFDVWMYQHDYRDSGKEIVNIALEKGIAEKDSSGAVIARLEKYGIPDKVLLRSDGTSIYSTQDLQLAKDSFEKHNLDQRLYVVDYRQTDYFKQIFKILEILGFEFADKLKHIPYGVVKIPEGHMSSRKGTVINADEVFDKLVELELDEIEKNAGKIDDPLNTAKKVALAAYRYGLLKVDPAQDITFDYSYVTRFDGNTGPYLMYTYARTNSILDKSDYAFNPGSFSKDVSLLDKHDFHPREDAILRTLYKFSEEALNAAIKYSPNMIANYLFDLAQKFNAMYAVLPILNAENEQVKKFRLSLTKSVGQVLKNGLNLLGIEVVAKM